jgi:hypothetical protein
MGPTDVFALGNIIILASFNMVNVPCDSWVALSGTARWYLTEADPQ